MSPVFLTKKAKPNANKSENKDKRKSRPQNVENGGVAWVRNIVVPQRGHVRPYGQPHPPYQPPPQYLQPPVYAHLAPASTNNLLPAPPRYSLPQHQPTLPQYASYSQPHLPIQNQQPTKPVGTDALNRGAALCDQLQDFIDKMITNIDTHGEADDLLRDENVLLDDEKPGVGRTRGLKLASCPATLGRTYFSKVWLYSNSRLPPHLPPFKVYLPTYPLICVAAEHSLLVYKRPPPSQPLNQASDSATSAQIHVPSSTRLGTKAMFLAVRPVETTNTIVLAIRGSATFADWAVNFRPSPSSPQGFLDDPGNLVHAGFLAVAKSMISVVAEKLRDYLQQDTGKWTSASLMFTGHSAGGAVASLLFCHMMSQSASVTSELKDLNGIFRRVHCITFGAPPISLLPLQKPSASNNENSRAPARGHQRGARTADRRWEKSLFFAFINEGDPVARADRSFVRSLVSLYTTPAPTLPAPLPATALANTAVRPPAWKVPPTSLSNAGRLVVLRPMPKAKTKKRVRFLSLGGANDNGGGGSAAQESEKIEAVLTNDDQLRTVIFGDPAVHSMKLYLRRVKLIAANAATGGSLG